MMIRFHAVGLGFQCSPLFHFRPHMFLRLRILALSQGSICLGMEGKSLNFSSTCNGKRIFYTTIVIAIRYKLFGRKYLKSIYVEGFIHQRYHSVVSAKLRESFVRGRTTIFLIVFCEIVHWSPWRCCK